jgi:hypothetical protein
VTNQHQVLSKDTTVGNDESVTWAGSVDDQEQKALWTLVSGARPNLNTRDAQALEEVVAALQDVFATKSGDYWRTNKACHRIDTGDAHPILQPHADCP